MNRVGNAAEKFEHTFAGAEPACGPLGGLSFCFIGAYAGPSRDGLTRFCGNSLAQTTT